MSQTSDTQSSAALTLADVLASVGTAAGETLDELSRGSPVLVVFLRHGGCPFCRETLSELADKRSALQKAGVRLVLVHMMSDEQAARLFAGYGLGDVPRVSDAERKLYRAFELKTGSAGDVMGPKVWWRGFKTTVLKGNLPGRPIGDVFQLGGAFLLADGKIISAFRNSTSYDRPDYLAVATCELPAAENREG